MTGRERKGSLLRRLLSFAGIALVLLSLVFVALRLSQHLTSLRLLASPSGLLLLGGSAVAYGSSLLLLSYAFYLLLRWQGEPVSSAAEAHRIYGRAQITKYLPGNVLQFVARHVAYRQRGVGDRALALAALYEALGMAGAAACLALLGLPNLPVSLADGRGSDLGLALALGLGAAACGILLIPRAVGWVSRWRGWSPTSPRLRARDIARVMPLYAAFFLVSGALALILHSWAAPAAGSFAIVPGYALAWLCGFIIPGASAGLGVREAVLMLLFGQDPAALFTAVGMRVITTLGDVLLLVAMTLWRAKRAQPDQAS